MDVDGGGGLSPQLHSVFAAYKAQGKSDEEARVLTQALLSRVFAHSVARGNSAQTPANQNANNQEFLERRRQEQEQRIRRAQERQREQEQHQEAAQANDEGNDEVRAFLMRQYALQGACCTGLSGRSFPQPAHSVLNTAQQLALSFFLTLRARSPLQAARVPASAAATLANPVYLPVALCTSPLCLTSLGLQSTPLWGPGPLLGGPGPLG